MATVRTFKVKAAEQSRLNSQLATDLAPLFASPLADAQLVRVSKAQPAAVAGVRRFARATSSSSTTTVPLIAGTNLLPHPLGRPVVLFVVCPDAAITLPYQAPNASAPGAPDESLWFVLVVSAACNARILVA